MRFIVPLRLPSVHDSSHAADGPGQFSPRTKCVRYTEVLVNKLIFANLAHRPVRTLLSILAIGVEVTMILTLVGVSYGTLDASARRARGIGADVFVRPPGTSAIGLSSAPMSEKTIAVLGAKPGVVLATGTMVQSLGGFATIQGVDFPAINRMASTWRGSGTTEKDGFKFLQGTAFQQPDDIIVDEFYAKEKKLHPGEPPQAHQPRLARRRHLRVRQARRHHGPHEHPPAAHRQRRQDLRRLPQAQRPQRC